MKAYTYDELSTEEQQKADALFSPEEIGIRHQYEFVRLGERLVRRMRGEFVTAGGDRTDGTDPTDRTDGGRAAARPSEGERVLQVDPRVLRDSPFQVRESYDENWIEELAGTIRQVGVIHALIVRERFEGTREKPMESGIGNGNGTFFEIVVGHSRKRGAIKAEQATVPVIVRELTDAQAAEIVLIENLQRKDLNPMEEARGLQKMLDLEAEDGKRLYDRESLATRLGKTPMHVGNQLRLLRLPKMAQQAIQRGVIGESIGYLIAQVPSPSMRALLTKEVLAGHDGGGAMSAREVKEHIRRQYMVDLRTPPFNPEDENLVPVREKDGERVAGGACGSCPLNSANQPAGDEGGKRFPLCTNPGCFAEKVSANIEVVKAKALASGALVIDGERGRALIYHDGTPQHGSGMINVAKAPTSAEVVGKGAPGTWGEMLEGPVKPQRTVVIDERGRAHELVKRTLAIEAAKKNGYKDVFTSRAGREKSPADTQQQERVAKEKAAKKLESATAVAAMEELVVQIGKQGVRPEAWWGMLDLALFHAATDAQEFVCQRRALSVKDGKREAALRAHAKTLSAERMPGFVIELLLAAWVRLNGVECAGFRTFAGLYGLEVKAIRARVRVGIAETGKRKADTGKKGSGSGNENEGAPSVRAEIVAAARRHGLKTPGAIDAFSRKELGKAFRELAGSELRLLLDAIKALPAGKASANKTQRRRGAENKKKKGNEK